MLKVRHYGTNTHQQLIWKLFCGRIAQNPKFLLGIMDAASPRVKEEQNHRVCCWSLLQKLASLMFWGALEPMKHLGKCHWCLKVYTGFRATHAPIHVTLQIFHLMQTHAASWKAKCSREDPELLRTGVVSWAHYCFCGRCKWNDHANLGES